MVTGRHKIIARYRSYHGATTGAITLTGDPRRWANEPGDARRRARAGSVPRPSRAEDDAATALANLEETIELEGPQTIAAFFLETVTGTNGILIPPDGYLQGVRELCDRHGILMISDEVMSGFGRTGEWFAVDHWDVVPDSSRWPRASRVELRPAGRCGDAPARSPTHFEDNVVLRRPDLQLAPAGLRRGARHDQRVRGGRPDRDARKMGDVLARHHKLAERHPSVGAVRNIGLFGIMDLVKAAEPRADGAVQRDPTR